MPFHEACLKSVTHDRFAHLHQLVLCGKASRHSLEAAKALDALERLGLITAVSSGSFHLTAIQRTWMPNGRPGARSRITWNRTFHEASRILLWSAMGLFCLCRLCQASTMRALFVLILRRINGYFRLSWRGSQILTWSGILSLPFCLFQRHPLAGLSGLLVGWAASLAAALAHEKNQSVSIFQTKFYLLLLPAIASFSIPSPVAVFAQAICYPYLGLFLLSSAICVALAPNAGALIDPILSQLLKFIDVFGRSLPEPMLLSNLPLAFAGLYVAGLSFHLARREQIL